MTNNNEEARNRLNEDGAADNGKRANTKPNAREERKERNNSRLEAGGSRVSTSIVWVPSIDCEGGSGHESDNRVGCSLLGRDG